LGPEPAIKVDLTSQQVKRGDVLILCSDGLSGQVRANEIAEVVSREADLVQVCKALIDLANEAGGPDNITVVAVRFEGEGLVETDVEQPEHRVYRGSQERPTIPLDRASIPQLSAMDDDTPTLEVEPVRPERMTVGNAADGPTVRIAPSQVRAKLPPEPPPGGRIPAGTLRVVFGTLALLVAAASAWFWFRR
jgi:hypothetical protein